jgi:serine protease Do
VKRNRSFRIDNFLWPVLIFAAVAIVALWTNMKAMPQRWVPDTQNPGGQTGVELSVQPLQPPGPAAGRATVPYGGLQIQEEINHAVSIVRPAVVTVSMPTAAQDPPGTDLSYISPYSNGRRQIGSGVIVDRRGYVLTTFQTVGKETAVRVKLFSGGKREYAADVVSVDAKTDLALLKIRAAEDFPTVILGNSELVEVGDLVFALGSPFGFSRTVTMGIVSSSQRQLRINGIRYPDMIQTDAVVNDGNDGGPLLNIRGEVIGINIACFMPDNHYAGIGFAIPINDAVSFINSSI